MSLTFQTLNKLRFYSSVIAVYAVTLLFAWFAYAPDNFPLLPRPHVAASPLSDGPQLPDVNEGQKLIYGKPVRIVIESLGVDLPVNEGFYNPVDSSWTLTEKNAHFAMPSNLANNIGGNTLIYGHNNQYVFAILSNLQPGDMAKVYTDSGHIFQYYYQSSEDVMPNNVNTFRYDGLPILTLQTCSGNWYELRRMFTFGFWQVT